jgi:hypothetical protein
MCSARSVKFWKPSLKCENDNMRACEPPPNRSFHEPHLAFAIWGFAQFRGLVSTDCCLCFFIIERPVVCG